MILHPSSFEEATTATLKKIGLTCTSSEEDAMLDRNARAGVYRKCSVESDPKKSPLPLVCTPPTSRQRQRSPKEEQPTQSTALVPPAMSQQALQTTKDKELNNLSPTLTSLSRAHSQPPCRENLPSATHLARRPWTLEDPRNKQRAGAGQQPFEEAMTIIKT